MPNPSKRQRRAIAGFLQTSRTYFNLGHGSAGYHSRGGHTLRTVVKSLLIASSIGGPVGEIAYAGQLDARSAESREGRREADPYPVAIEPARASSTHVGVPEVQAAETHSEFIERASQVFPERLVTAWTRLERAVFNQLMAQLIYRYGYAGINDQMLEDVRHEMSLAVKRVTGTDPALAQPLAPPTDTPKA